MPTPCILKLAVANYHVAVSYNALHDSTIGNGLYAAAAFDRFREHLLDAATGANDWMYFGASDLLAQTVPQIPAAWSRLEDESMTHMELLCYEATMQREEMFTIWLTGSLRGGSRSGKCSFLFPDGSACTTPPRNNRDMHTEACSGELPYGGELQFMS